MQGLFSSLTDKAQSALNSTPFGRSGQGSDGGSSGQSSGSGGILKSHAFESIQHQLRTFQQQYSSSVSPVQKIITAEKGVAIDFDGVGHDARAFSKELYTWGQNEDEDIKDVSDRLAWMNYIQGALAATLAEQIDASRAPLKVLRDAENNLNGRRNIRANLETQISRIEHDQRRGMEQKLAELKRQLRQAEEEDEPLEKEVQLLKRKALRESERLKWEAMREYGEKLALIAQAAAALVPALPDIPPSQAHPYTGAQLTASVRKTLQQALDNYRVGDSVLYLQQPSAADLGRSDTRSFGVTHATELASISTADHRGKPGIPVTPPAISHDTPPQAPSHTANIAPPPTSSPIGASPVNVPKATSPPAHTASPPLNPAALNQAPAPIPIHAGSPTAVAAPDPLEPSVKVPTVTPTVAETGMPESAGPDGPGPASGSLLDLKQPTPSPAPGSTATSPGYASGSTAPSAGATQPNYESAEEEKRRLEREERERILAAGGSSNLHQDPDAKDQPPPDDGELPPYQEF
ncbi:hypothetical protein BN946_scf184868.g47 [Trametes cinnabarina]|uniref:Sphingolipid long chain base-responsive protein LSP1 n=1 Tax=Pycnoporus cinnabarinus TaxID=5643 RepID=A0A060SVV3_PYCCI|nr:hypothetical protein BN946_scf184868.g47 [Trametes cinnabarina]